MAAAHAGVLPQVDPQDGMEVALHCELHNRFLKMGGPNLGASSSLDPELLPGNWKEERFRVRHLQGNRWAFHSTVNNRFIHATNNAVRGGGQRDVNVENVPDDEIFEVRHEGGGEVSLFNVHRQRFVEMNGPDPQGAFQIVCTQLGDGDPRTPSMKFKFVNSRPDLDRIMIVSHNERGGVGKSTNVRTLGMCLRHIGYRVLMVDLDPQRSLTKAFLSTLIRTQCNNSYESFLKRRYTQNLPPGAQAGWRRATLGQMINRGYDNQGNIIEPQRGGVISRVFQIEPRQTPAIPGGDLFLVIGDSDYSKLEQALNTADHNLNGGMNPHEYRSIPGCIQRTLQATARALNVDFILVDLAPSVSLLTVYTIFSAHYVLFSSRAEPDSISGIEQMTRRLGGNDHWVSNQGNVINNAPLELQRDVSEMGWQYHIKNRIWREASVNNPTPLVPLTPRYLGFIVNMLECKVSKKRNFDGGLIGHIFASTEDGNINELRTAFMALKARFRDRQMSLPDARYTAIGEGNVHLNIEPCLGIVPPSNTFEKSALQTNNCFPFFIRDHSGPHGVGDYITRERVPLGQVAQWRPMDQWNITRGQGTVAEGLHIWLQITWNLVELIFRDLQQNPFRGPPPVPPPGGPAPPAPVLPVFMPPRPIAPNGDIALDPPAPNGTTNSPVRVPQGAQNANAVQFAPSLPLNHPWKEGRNTVADRSQRECYVTAHGLM